MVDESKEKQNSEKIAWKNIQFFIQKRSYSSLASFDTLTVYFVATLCSVIPDLQFKTDKNFVSYFSKPYVSYDYAINQF